MVLDGEGICLTLCQIDDDFRFEGAQSQERGGEIGDGIGEGCGGRPMAITQQATVVGVPFADDEVRFSQLWA